MPEILKAKKFYIFFLIATVMAFLLLINFERTYQSQTEILVIFKSEKAAQNADIILENLTILPGSLSFYDRVIQAEEDAKNEAVSELPDYKRKKYWNEIIEIKRAGESSVLQFIAKSDDAYTAEILSTQAVKSLIGVIGAYYDIRNDIDIRIIEGPITKTSFSGSYIYTFIRSLLAGFFLAFISYYFLLLFAKNQPKEKPQTKLAWTYKETPKSIPTRNATPSVASEKEKSTKTEIKKVTKPDIIKEEYISIFGKKAAAPDNLPIAEDIPAFEQPPKEESEEQIEKTPLTHEATAEEVKERLNKLLSGKL